MRSKLEGGRKGGREGRGGERERKEGKGGREGMEGRLVNGVQVPGDIIPFVHCISVS